MELFSEGRIARGAEDGCSRPGNYLRNSNAVPDTERQGSVQGPFRKSEEQRE